MNTRHEYLLMKQISSTCTLGSTIPKGKKFKIFLALPESASLKIILMSKACLNRMAGIIYIYKYNGKRQNCKNG